MKQFFGIMIGVIVAALAFIGAHDAVTQGINPVTIVPHWARFQATGDLDNSTDVSIKAAATGKVYCVTSIQVSDLDTLGSIQVVRLLSNDTVIWQWATAAAGANGQAAVMPDGVCTVAGEALEIDVSGDPTDNLIFYSVQGFTVN